MLNVMLSRQVLTRRMLPEAMLPLVTGALALVIGVLPLILSPPALAAPPRATPPDGPVVTDHFEVVWSGPHDAVATEAVREDSRWLETAFERMETMLGFIPAGRVRVTLFPTADAYHAAGGTGDATVGSISAAGLLLAPDPAHPDRDAAALTRLYARYAVAQRTGGRAAPWLADGIALYLSDGFTPSLETLAPAAQAGRLADLGPGTLLAGENTASAAASVTVRPPRRGPGLEIPLADLIPATPSPSSTTAGVAGPSPAHPGIGEGAGLHSGLNAQPAAQSDPQPIPESVRRAADPAALRNAEAAFAVYYLQAMVGEGTLSHLLEQIGQGRDWTEALKAAANLRPAEFEAAWQGMARNDVVAFTPPGDHAQSWSTTARTVLDLPKPPAPGKMARIRIAVGRTVLNLTDQVDALLVAGGDVDVQGTVTCRIGVLGGNLRIGPMARVAGQISVLGGTLTIDPGALVDAKVEISSRSWKPGAVGGARQTLAVTIDRPMAMDLRLPGQSYVTGEGAVSVPAGQSRDAAMAVGGTLEIDGTVTGRAAAIGGDVNLASAPDPALRLIAVGGDLTTQGHPVDAAANVLRIGNFDELFSAPVQPGPDPVPVYLGVGDTTISRDQAYDAILSVGGRCIVDGVVRGGLVVGGDVAGLKGSTLTGRLWVFGGRIRVQKGAEVAGLVTLGDAAD